MQTYTVHTNGVPIKTFTDKVEAQKFLISWTHGQALHELQLKMIDEAVEKSDLSKANELIKYIMEKK
jgi:hypothetical protein